MDELLSQFPDLAVRNSTDGAVGVTYLAEDMFENLDDESLLKCKEAFRSRAWFFCFCAAFHRNFCSVGYRNFCSEATEISVASL